MLTVQSEKFPIKSLVVTSCILAGLCYLFFQLTVEYEWKNWNSFVTKEIMKPKRYLSSRFSPEYRLGNHIMELVGVYGISRTLNRTPTFWIENEGYRKMLEDVKVILPGLVDQYTVFEGKRPSHVKTTPFHKLCCIFDDPERLKNITDQYLHLGGYIYSTWKYTSEMRDEIRSYLAPMKEFKILPKSDRSTHVTCVHARRGDFHHNGFYASNANFIRKAVDYIQKFERNKKRLKMTTVIFGDDRRFIKELYPNTVSSKDNSSAVQNDTVHFISANSPTDDLLYSSRNCDVVLISAPVSTFGWWLGNFSKGNRVFYLDVRTVSDALYKAGKMHKDDFYPPKWTSLKFSKDNLTVVESDN